jgi:TRAP-type C4-dicarboxylate transport system substrate-binding protein
MKRSLISIVALVGVLVFIFDIAAARTLRINESLGPGSPEAAALEAFKNIVEQKSNGELEIRIYLQDQLGNPQTSIENLMTGTLELYSGALSYYAKLAPDELSMLTLLYFFKDREHFRRYLKSPVFQKARDKMISQGIRFISTEFRGDRGPYRVYVSSKPIMAPDDLKGVKMRIWPNEPVKKCWEHMGAVPIVLPWTETYLAIKQNMVQAVTSPLSLVRSMRFTEVAPYVTELKQFQQTWPMTISEKVWQQLPSDQQQILVDAANEAGKVYTGEVMNRAETDIQAMMKENNAVFIRVNTEQFEKKMLPFYDQLIKEGVVKKDIFEAVQNLK